MLISLHPTGYTHKPNLDQIRLISSEVAQNPTAVTLNELASAINNGQTWVPSTFKVCPDIEKRRRKLAFFDQSSVVALDFDHDMPTTEQLGKAHLGHYTFSATPQNPRCRLVYLLESAISDISDYKATLRSLGEGFDKACSDVTRLFFGGAPGCVFMINPEATPLPITKAEVVSRTASVKSLGELDCQNIIQALTTVKNKDLRRFKYIYAVYRRVFSELINVKGSRYEAVWNSARQLAQIPEFNESVVVNEISRVVVACPIFSDWSYNVVQVSLNGFRWGKENCEEI